MAVTLYINNRLEEAVTVDPTELATEFLQATRDGYELPTRGSIEFGYRWWLSGPEGRGASWDESEWATMVDGLVECLAANPGAKDELWKKVCP